MRKPKLINNTISLTASARIQAVADRGDTKSAYEEIRKAVGPTKKSTSPFI